MEQNKDEAIERMKKIQEANRNDPGESLDRAMQSPYFIHRPTAPKVSAEAALPMDWQAQEQREQERQQNMEWLKTRLKPVQEANDTVKQDSVVSPTDLFAKTEQDVPLSFGTTKEANATTLEKPKNEPQQSSTEETRTYHGFKMTKDQQEICDGLTQNLTKGKAMTNMENLRMKYKQ